MTCYLWKPLIRLSVVPEGAGELVYVFSDRARAREMLKFLRHFFPEAEIKLSDAFN